MLYKRCGSCGRKIPYDSVCPCIAARRREYNKRVRYDKSNIKFERFYHSSAWEDVRTRAIKLYYHMDILEYFRTGQIVEGRIMHHIVELKDNFNRADDISNLIYLTDSNHKKVHALYEKNQKSKTYIQNVLFSYIERWEKEYTL